MGTTVSPMVKSLGVIIVISLAARSYFQTFYWHDSEALWQHAIDVTPRNHIAHNSLANALLEKSELESAIIHYRESLAIKPKARPSKVTWERPITKRRSRRSHRSVPAGDPRRSPLRRSRQRHGQRAYEEGPILRSDLIL